MHFSHFRGRDAGTIFINRSLLFLFMMRRFLILVLILAFVFLNGTLNSCSRDEIPPGTQKNPFDQFHKAAGTANDHESSASDQPFEYSTTGSVKGRNGNKLKSIHYKTYNTNNVFVVELSYNTSDYQSLESSNISVNVAGQVLDQTIINRNIGIFSYSLNDLKPGWKIGDLVQWSFTETGCEESISFFDSYILTGPAEQLQAAAL